MFQEKLPAKATVQVGPCWPDTGHGGVAACLNWAGTKPTPTVPSPPQDNTMYPWEQKLYPPKITPPTADQSYPWQKDMKKLPNTPAPDMERWNNQRKRLAVQEEVFKDGVHSPSSQEQSTLKARPPTGRRPLRPSTGKPSSVPCGRKVEVIKDNYIDMHDSNSQLTPDDIKIIRQVAATSRNRPLSAKQRMPGGTYIEKENLYPKTYKDGSTQYAATPPRSGLMNRPMGSPSVLRGTAPDVNSYPHPPTRKITRTAWQDDEGQGYYQAAEEDYDVSRLPLGSRQADYNTQQIQYRNNYTRRPPPTPYAYTDSTPNHRTNEYNQSNKYPTHNGHMNGYDYRMNTSPNYTTRSRNQDYPIDDVYQPDDDVYSSYDNPYNGHDHQSLGTNRFAPKTPIETGSQQRGVKFAEKLDSSRWIKSNRYTPQPPSRLSTRQEGDQLAYNDPLGGVHVAVDCDPDTEVTVKVTPGGYESSDNQERAVTYQSDHKYKHRYKPLEKQLYQRLPWR